jgi:hypothetical protein
MVPALLLLTLLAAAPAVPADPKLEIAEFQKALITALKKGDRAQLERLIADGFTFVHSTGGLDTKKIYIDSIVTGAQAGRATDIERLDEHIEIFDGHTAVNTTRGIVRRAGDETLLRSTHVYIKRGDGWQWAGGQSTRLPSRPKATATLTAELRRAYAGRYAINPDRVLTVREEGDLLKASLPGFREAELIPRTETELAWFNPELNIESQILFIRDETGIVTHAVYRRDGKDIWRAARVP